MEGGVAWAGERGRGGPPGLLFLIGGLFPRRQGSGAGAPVGFVCGSREALEVRAGHHSMMPEACRMVAQKSPRISARSRMGQRPGLSAGVALDVLGVG